MPVRKFRIFVSVKIYFRLMPTTTFTTNKQQSNSVKGGIAELRCHLLNHKSFFSQVGGNCMFFAPQTPQMFLSPKGLETPFLHNVSSDPTNMPAKWHLDPSKGLSKVYECDRRQRDRQTTLCVAMAEIAHSDAACIKPDTHRTTQSVREQGDMIPAKMSSSNQRGDVGGGQL